MAETFMIVLRQTLVIVLLMGIGFFCGKKKILDDASANGLNQFVCTFVITCACISGFMLECTPERARSFLLGLGLGIGLHVLNFLVALVLYPKRKDARRWLHRVTLLLTNCGFMGFPMLTAVLGEDGVFFGLPFFAVMVIASWMAGPAIVSEDPREIRVKSILQKPPIWGVVAGLILFLFSVKLPTVLNSTVGFVSALNTPMPMILVGYYMIHVDFRPLLKDLKFWGNAALRLVILPLLSMVILLLFGVSGPTLIAMVICNACPPAAVVSLLARKYGKDAATASAYTSLQTLLSVATMPPVIALCALLAK